MKQKKSVEDEKRSLQDQIEQIEREDTQTSRRTEQMDELREWLAQQPVAFKEYDDSITRKMVTKITVVDAETVRIKIQDMDMELEQKLC